MRERTAEAILSLLGSKRKDADEPAPEPEEGTRMPEMEGFAVQERNMVSGVLTLVDRSVRSIMTPRTDVSWINLEDDKDTILRLLKTVPHSFFPVCRGTVDEVAGVGRARDLLADVLTTGGIRRESLRQPIIVHESIGILALMDTLRRSRGQLVMVTDEFGNIEGLVTPIDVFEAIAGEFPDEDEMPEIMPDGERRWRVSGAADLHHLEQTLDVEGLVDEAYSTLAGYLLAKFDHLPDPGQVLEEPGIGLRFTVQEVVGRRIVSVLVERRPTALDLLADETEPA